MLMLRTDPELKALHVCETSASSVEALLPHVTWVVSQGAVADVVGVASVVACVTAGCVDASPVFPPIVVEFVVAPAAPELGSPAALITVVDPGLAVVPWFVESD